MKTIELHGVGKRKGPTLSQDLYELIKDFIISTITNHPEGSIPFNELLDEADRNFSYDLASVLPWHIMQVKIDLQERGILKTSIDRHRKQIIAFNPRNKNKWTALI